MSGEWSWKVNALSHLNLKHTTYTKHNWYITDSGCRRRCETERSILKQPCHFSLHLHPFSVTQDSSHMQRNHITTEQVYYVRKAAHILNKVINATLLFLHTFFMSWTQRSKTFSMYTKGLFLSNIVHKSVLICVSEHFSFAEIIHPPHRCGISRCWLDSMIIAQVCFRLATIKGHSKMCSFITQHNATDVASIEGACNWHADCRNVHQICCPWIECSFLYHKPSPKAFQRIWRYIQPASQPQTTCNHTSPGPPHQHLHLQDRLRPATQAAAATIGLNNQRISAQTVRNRLREAHLHPRHPHRGLDLTAVRHRNWLERENTHIQWHLALWRGVLFTD